jgi:acetyl esterase/lipase
MTDNMIGSYNPELGTSLYDTFNDPSGHADLPPAYLQASGGDMLRDDSIIYERVLREEYKIPTRIDIYKGMPHMFWSFFPTFKTTRQWREDMVEGVRWLLQQRK